MAVERDRRGQELVSLNLRRLRVEHGLTQQELAEASEVPRSHIGEIETKGVNITIDVLVALADALGEDPRELLRPVTEMFV